MEIPKPFPAIEPRVLEAEPEPLEIDVQRTALMVIDMQNAFIEKSGMFDLMGEDISKGQNIIGPIKRVSTAARKKSCILIYTAAAYSADLHETGGPNSPSWYKNKNLIYYRESPELRDKLTVHGTWGADIVEDLTPHQNDIIVEKQKFSAFFGTNLDTILKTYNIKYLAFTGVNTNICVEATIRDAYYLEYFPILLTDACANAGPPFTQEATIYNVRLVYGWVTTTEDFIRALK
jgi:ureidoacrylate peracid hydrolase